MGTESSVYPFTTITKTVSLGFGAQAVYEYDGKSKKLLSVTFRRLVGGPPDGEWGELMLSDERLPGWLKLIAEEAVL